MYYNLVKLSRNVVSVKYKREREHITHHIAHQHNLRERRKCAHIAWYIIIYNICTELLFVWISGYCLLYNVRKIGYFIKFILFYYSSNICFLFCSILINWPTQRTSFTPITRYSHILTFGRIYLHTHYIIECCNVKYTSCTIVLTLLK